MHAIWLTARPIIHPYNRANKAATKTQKEAAAAQNTARASHFFAGTSDDATNSLSLCDDIAECMSASARVYAILIKSLVAGRRVDGERASLFHPPLIWPRFSGKSTYTHAVVAAKRRPRMELLLVGDRKMRLPHLKPCGAKPSSATLFLGQTI
jgi:hypothetical protein